MAELFDDHSPLRLMGQRAYRAGWQGSALHPDRPPAVPGRAGPLDGVDRVLQDGGSGVLSEDNGAYVFTRPARLGRDAPAPEQLRVGMTTAVGGQPFSVAANMQVRLVSAQGELPKLPPLGQPFQVVELRSADGEVLSIDYGSQPPQVQRGRAVRLQDLRLVGIKDESARDEQGRQFNCLRCGAPVRVELASSKSCTCPACDSIIDLSAGPGASCATPPSTNPCSR